MNLSNLFVMADSITCGDFNMVWTIFGYIIFAIEVVVPILLIISGMITMANAVMQKDEKKIKEAQNLLVKKLIAAVIVFLVIAVTKLVVGLVATGDNGETGDAKWESCVSCALNPFGDGCGFEKATINTPGE